MSQSFNLVAQLKLQGPQNINQVVNRIQSRLNNIQANVALNIPRNANTALRNFNSTLTRTNNILQQVNSGQYSLYVQKQPGSNIEELSIDLESENKIKSYNPTGFSANKIDSRNIRWRTDLTIDKRFSVNLNY